MPVIWRHLKLSYLNLDVVILHAKADYLFPILGICNGWKDKSAPLQVEQCIITSERYFLQLLLLITAFLAKCFVYVYIKLQSRVPWCF